MTSRTERPGYHVSVATALPVPAIGAAATLAVLLKSAERQTGSISLNVALSDLGAPLGALIAVPVRARVTSAHASHEWGIAIEAAERASLYPTFTGVMTLVPTTAAGCAIQLNGTYVPPLGKLGRAIDMTLLRGTAETTLRHFVRELASMITERVRWSQFV